jgi:hypothetical protein
MGYWENTTYLQHADHEEVASELVRLIEAEGLRRIARPPVREPGQYDPMQYKGADENALWGVAVFPGAAGWTVIKTAPLELLGERAKGKQRMRLPGLCAALGCAGFQYNVYDSSGAVLVEVDSAGNVLLSGIPYDTEDEPDQITFHGEPWDVLERFDIRFEVLPLEALPDFDGLAQQLAEQLGGLNREFCDNLTSVVTLQKHLPLEAAGGIELYFKRSR